MRRAKARKRREAYSAEPADRGLHCAATAPYEPLSKAAVTRLIDTAIDLLEQSGVRFEPGTEADDLLCAAGCEIGADGIVRIPGAVTRAALKSVARSTLLWNRDASRSIRIDCDHTWFMPGMTCIAMLDPETGAARPSNREDLALVTRLADSLPEIDAVCISVKNVARSDQFGEIDEFACMMENTTKPLEYLCEHASSLGAVIEMAAAVRGGREALREKPYFMAIVTPLPVSFAASHIGQIIMAARAGVPLNVGTLPIGGASSPITLGGCITHALITDFAAMVLGQLAAPGCFCIGASDVCFMEPATGAIGSFSQTSLADAAVCQIRRSLRLPSLTGINGTAVARRFNQDAVWELSANMMQAFYSRPATCDYLGSLDLGLTFSLHALLLCDDMAGLLRKMWQGFAADAAEIGVDVIRDVGPSGNFLAEQHTVDHCRAQVWNSRYFGANIPLSNTGLPDQDLFERLDNDLQARLADLSVPDLPEALAAEIRAILARY
ncbi:MAG: trimethylamine methyltransferase family protein [Rhodobacteraceae bacterium]|nr:trimethylamine methyltransferase family protein [Paracoccaceae bacterium]